MNKQSMTTKEAAVRLSVSIESIRQLVLAGELPAEKFGRDLMIKTADLARVKVYGKPGRPSKSGDGIAVSTATNALDDGMPSVITGVKPLAKPVKRSAGKKAATKAGRR